jgi:Na+/H+ antiporter NhaD/arsenite permease-like protein
MEPMIVGTLIFSLTFLLIFIEIIHKTLSALLGVFLMIFFGIVTFTDIGKFINFEVLALVFGVMVIIEVIKESGIFQFLGIKAVKIAKGNKKTLFILLMILTTLISVFLNSVTSMLIMGALTFTLCRHMKLNPIPFIIGESIFVDIGDTVLLTSSIPNMLVAEAAKFTFMDYVYVTTPFSIILVLVSIPILLFFYKKEFQKKDIMKVNELDEWSVVPNKSFFWKSLIILLFTSIFFMISDYIGVARSFVAISSAIIILLLSGADIDNTLKSIDWGALFFFGGLFIIVGGVEKVGFLKLVANQLITIIGTNKVMSVPLLTWVSTAASGVIDNVPVTVTLVPIAKTMVAALGINMLWWSLVLGANLGGNITPISSPSNVIAMSIAKNEGHPLPFREFMKIGIIITIVHISLATVYLTFLFLLSA